MGPAEVVHRVGEQCKRTVSRFQAQGWARFEDGAAFTPVEGLRERFVAHASPALRERLRASVADLLAGAFRIHDTVWPRPGSRELFPPEIWRLDPISGKLWPGAETYTFDARRRAEGLGDVKYVWDFHRLQFLQPMAAAVALWDDAAAEPAIEAAIASWMAANPPWRGVGWNSGIELAMRAFSLCWTATLCHGALSRSALSGIATVLRAHLFWLLRFPSLHSSANNHRVAELAAELAIAAVLPGLPSAREITARAAAALIAEIPRQIHADGVGAEQSPSYAAFTVELMLAADLMAAGGNGSLLTPLRERLGAFVDHVGWLADDAGRVPSIGDNDGGRVFTAFGAVETGYSVSIARAAAARLGLPCRVPPPRDPPELRDAVFGEPRHVAPPPTGLASFRLGGYTIARERRAGRSVRLILDHGALGHLSIAAHGHADALAFTLSLDGVEVFVDPGAYLYHAGGAWREWLRSTRAHNTLALAGESQSVAAGAFNWSRKANARLETTSESSGEWSVAASQDGYKKRWGFDHRRSISSHADGLEIVDTLSAPTSQIAEVALQLGPGLAITGEGRHWRICQVGADLIVRVEFSLSGDIRAKAGGEIGEGGWISPRFGVKAPAPRLRWRGVLARDGLRTNISWGRP
jgi:hypothetical protein